MLVYEYVNKILSDLNGKYNATMKAKVINTICNAFDIPSEVRYLELSYQDMLQPDNNPIIAQVLLMLGLSDDNYVKYYLLDLITSGDFVTGLIKSMCKMAQKEIMYIINFDLLSFMMVKSVPTLHVTYEAGLTSFGINNIVYDQPINGMMDMEDAYSIIADLFAVLNPDKITDFITTRLYNQLNTIKCSNKRSIIIKEYVSPVQESPIRQILPATGMGLSHFSTVEFGTILSNSAEPRLIHNTTKIELPLDYFCSRLGITLETLNSRK